jgi:TnpA family transposase
VEARIDFQQRRARTACRCEHWTPYVIPKTSLPPGAYQRLHISDLWIPFYTQVITRHVRQAPYILDGLLYHATRLDPREHYTDTWLHGADFCGLPSTRHPFCAAHQGPDSDLHILNDFS